MIEIELRTFDDRIRTVDGQIILPIMSIERTSVTKDPTFKGGVQANVINDINSPRGYRGGGLPIARRINQEKTRNFAIADQDRRLGGDDNVKKKFTKTNKKHCVPIHNLLRKQQHL